MKKYSKEFQQNLVWLYHATGNNKYLSQLLQINQPYFHKMAGREHKVFSKRVEFEDLVQECNIGFIVAVKKFDFDKDVHPLTYATLWMKTKMFERYCTTFPVHVPTHIVRAYKYNVANKEKMIEQVGNILKESSLDVNHPDGKSKDLKTIEPNRDYTYDTVERNLISPTITQALEKLTLIEREVFELKSGYITASTFKDSEIREDFNEPNPEKIYRSAKRKLKKELKSYSYC